MDGRYLYLTARSKLERPLIEAELLSFVGVCPDERGLGFSHIKSDISNAAYVKVGAELLAEAPDLNRLEVTVAEKRIEAEGFRIQVEKLADKGDLKSPEVAARIGTVIKGRPNLSRPKVKLLAVLGDDFALLGEVFSEYTKGWVRLTAKPYTTSSSIPHRLARLMINLSGVRPPARLVDPCCGVGTILLEGADMGYEVTGYDVNYKMYQASRKNLAYFNLPGEVMHADAREIGGEFDLLVTDLPYGRNAAADERLYDELIANFVDLAPVAVIVTAWDISELLLRHGYREVKVLHASKSNLIRHIHVARL